MKKILLVFIALLISTASFTQNNKITIAVTGIKAHKGGVVKTGLYKKDGFPLKGQETFGKNVEVSAAPIKVIFDSIPDGTYAVAVFQDCNKDEKLNTNLFGVPVEPYGFSKNKYGTFSPPDFDDVSFDLKNGAVLSLTINLK